MLVRRKHRMMLASALPNVPDSRNAKIHGSQVSPVSLFPSANVTVDRWAKGSQ